MIGCGIRQPMVIAEEATYLVANGECRRQMKRIERSQLPWLQVYCDVEHSVVEGKQRHPLQPFSRVLLRGPAEGTTGAYGLHPQQDAGNESRPARQLQTQLLMPLLAQRKLDVGRGIEIGKSSGYSRSSRCSSRTCVLDKARRGFGGASAASASRSRRGIVAPRSATRRAIGESPGPDGDSRATSTPLSVTTKVSPCLTFVRYFERFCRSCLTPTRFMCVTVARRHMTKNRHQPQPAPLNWVSHDLGKPAVSLENKQALEILLDQKKAGDKQPQRMCS
jgi:hypothetical protein